MALTKGPVLIEYVGKDEHKLNMTWAGHKVLNFEPKKAYGNRRIEQFASEKSAEGFLFAHNKPSIGKINFQIAEGLILEQDQKAIRRLVENSVGKMTETAIEQVIGAQLKALEFKVEALAKAVDRISKSAVAAAPAPPAPQEASA